MNKVRRSSLEEIIEKLSALVDELNEVCECEQEAYDNLPESLQYSEKGELLDENVNDIEISISDIEDVIETLTDLINR